MADDFISEFRSFAFIPEKSLDSYRELTDDRKSAYEIRLAFASEYTNIITETESPRIVHKCGNEIVEDSHAADHVYLVTNIPTIDGSQIVLSFVPNRTPDHQPWEMQRAIRRNDFYSENYLDLGSKPQDMLYNYAYWTSFNSDLRTLHMDIALKENWSFKQNPTDDDFPILKKYIKYTFAKLWKDRQVFISDDDRYSVFNTGLVNRNYQYIYAIFEKNSGQRPWKFSMFGIPGVRAGGRILNSFAQLPKPAHYFSDISDISYIISREKSPEQQLPDLQPDHYFIDHPDRLPRYFLQDGCRKNQELLRLLSIDITEYADWELREHWDAIGKAIAADADVYDDLESSFRNAVRKAVMRASWNYRTAIPVYFPSYDKMSILLPLSFSSDKDAEVALVVERNSISGNYIAPTILTLATAYSNARLVCKPESDWLNQQVLEPITSENTNDGDDAD